MERLTGIHIPTTRNDTTVSRAREQDDPFMVGSLDDLPDVLTVEETARILRRRRNGAYEVVARREVPSVHIGRRVLVPKKKMLQLLEEE